MLGWEERKVENKEFYVHGFESNLIVKRKGKTLEAKKLPLDCDAAS
jgi:hypothetical protein